MRWCLGPADFEVPNTIQPREYSKGGGTDGPRHGVFAVNVNWNAVDTERIVAEFLVSIGA